MNDKWWSALFGVVMLACGALFVVAPIVGWWMPHGVAEHTSEVDFLFYLILAITGFFFILTEALLVAFLYRYTACPPGVVCKPSFWWALCEPLANLFDTAKKIETAWTVVPGLILVYIAAAQVSAWADVKYKSRLATFMDAPKGAPVVQIDVSARQFEWRMRYPNSQTWALWKDKPAEAEKWTRNPNFDDVHVTNELHIIQGRHVVVQLSTKDVIHSFNIPHMRIKQDALPGKTIPVWFKPTDYNCEPVTENGKIVRWGYRGGENPATGKANDTQYSWEIACAELCGWGHYRMIGRTYVHKDEADFAAWLKWRETQQNNFGTIAPNY